MHRRGFLRASALLAGGAVAQRLGPAAPIERRLYITNDVGISVYDIDRGHALIRRIDVLNSGDYKGIAASVPLQVLVDKFSHARFEPSGMTKNPEVRFAKSIVDYIFRWMASKFLSNDAQYNAGVNGRELENGSGHTLTPTAPVPQPVAAAAASANPHMTIQNQEDAPPCSTCGSIMIRSGACYKCVNCGNTSGCA